VIGDGQAPGNFSETLSSDAALTPAKRQQFKLKKGKL
jgi:hypothetical protein